MRRFVVDGARCRVWEAGDRVPEKARAVPVHQLGEVVGWVEFVHDLAAIFPGAPPMPDTRRMGEAVARAFLVPVAHWTGDRAVLPDDEPEPRPVHRFSATNTRQPDPTHPYFCRQRVDVA